MLPIVLSLRVNSFLLVAVRDNVHTPLLTRYAVRIICVVSDGSKNSGEFWHRRIHASACKTHVLIDHPATHVHMYKGHTLSSVFQFQTIMNTRKPYHGPHRKLVLAFDVGTTFSGISYSILEPGHIPEIKGVTRFPSQEQVGGDSKIPSILYYDCGGVPRAIGAEALQENVLELAEDQNWTKVEWFKLHLRPKGMPVTHNIPPLPKNKVVVSVFADFLRYLYDCAKSYIQDTHVDGLDLWMSVEPHIEFVLTHPNGWEGAQQNRMRRAAALAGLIPDNESGQARLQFVTEGEASLHFCVQNGLTTDAIKDGNGVIIVDAGGGTVDLSAYVKTSASAGSSFEEIAPPQCHFNGSIFVTRHAQVFLAEKLRNSRFAEDVDNITLCFDKTTKLKFRNANEPAYIKFGNLRDTDPNLNIRSGQLKLSGTDVAAFFEPSIKAITGAITAQRSTAHKPISTVLLVGGFAASDWLFPRLRADLQSMGLNFYRPDSHVNKAVADGAISFYLDHFVSVRVARYTYGVEVSRQFDSANPEHLTRSNKTFVRPSGRRDILNGFDTILSKGIQVSETKEFKRSYFRESDDLSACSSLKESIICYRGRSQAPKWTDVEPETFVKTCTIYADTSQVPQTLRPQQGSTGLTYYTRNFDIILSFGLTELKAQIGWIEMGKERRSPAKIVYDQEVATNETADH